MKKILLMGLPDVGHVETPCPKCGNTLSMKKYVDGTYIVCKNPLCNYCVKVDTEDANSIIIEMKSEDKK